MLIRMCSACGHTNFSFNKRCLGCASAFPPRARGLSWRNQVSVLAVGLGLLAVCVWGLAWLVQHILPQVRALLFGA